MIRRKKPLTRTAIRRKKPIAKKAATKRPARKVARKTATKRTALKRTPLRRTAKKRARKSTLPRKPRPVRAELLARYKTHKEKLPQVCQCPVTGRWYEREDMEHHHPAGRRPCSYLFVVPVSPSGHRKIHRDPKWAEEHGLLWPGRNTRRFTYADALRMIGKVPHPKTFIQCVILWGATEHLSLDPQPIQNQPQP